jgi:hypothetical protein
VAIDITWSIPPVFVAFRIDLMPSRHFHLRHPSVIISSW